MKLVGHKHTKNYKKLVKLVVLFQGTQVANLIKLKEVHVNRLTPIPEFRETPMWFTQQLHYHPSGNIKPCGFAEPES